METLVIKKTFKVSKKQLFDAWTQPEMMEKWFFVGENWSAKSTTDLKVGGSYKNVMNTDEKETHEVYGTYKEVSPYDKLVFTWDSPMAAGTVVTLDFKEQGDGTELTLTHDLFKDTQSRDDHNKGWTGCLNNLEKFTQVTA